MGVERRIEERRLAGSCCRARAGDRFALTTISLRSIGLTRSMA